MWTGQTKLKWNAISNFSSLPLLEAWEYSYWPHIMDGLKMEPIFPISLLILLPSSLFLPSLQTSFAGNFPAASDQEPCSAPAKRICLVKFVCVWRCRQGGRARTSACVRACMWEGEEERERLKPCPQSNFLYYQLWLR